MSGPLVPELTERIRSEGVDLGSGILKVDGFLNHQVDPVLMDSCARVIAEEFRAQGVTKVLTVESSGIAPALLTAAHLGVPMIYARTKRPVTMVHHVYTMQAPSHTKGHTATLHVSGEWLTAGDRVLIVDDFLGSGATALGLTRIVDAAGGTPVGVAAVIEKSFEGGREHLESTGIPVLALATVVAMDDGRIVMARQ